MMNGCIKHLLLAGIHHLDIPSAETPPTGYGIVTTQWVRDNTEVFGGDPEKITVNGYLVIGRSSCWYADTCVWRKDTGTFPASCL